MVYQEEPKGFMPKMEVVSCFLEHNGKFLMLHRQDNKMEGNKWGVPAGKMEAGEKKEIAIIREVQEETGVLLNESQLHYWGKVYVRYPELDFIYHMFSVKLQEQPQIIIEEKATKDFAWVSSQESSAFPLVRDEDACIKLFYSL